MTMRLTVLASTFLFAAAVAASAQQVPQAPRATQVPRVEPVPAIPAVHVDLPEFHVDVPEFHVDVPEFHLDLPEFHLDHPFPSFDANLFGQEPFLIAGAQPDKPVIFQGVQPFNVNYQEANQADSWYQQARNRIDSNQYDRALEPLDRVISAKGARADAAMYWKAYSLMKLSRRDEALSTLGQLTKQFPESGWARDARALEVEVKQAAGQNVSADIADDETKLLALQGIMRTDPDAALPAVEKLLAGGGSVRLKDRALFVLSQSRNDKALGIISNVARTNANPDLKQKAIRYLGQSNSPDAISTLTTVYRADNSEETKKAVISALASSRNTGAITALITLARGERNAELKTTIVRHLSNSNSPEAKAYLLELLSK